MVVGERGIDRRFEDRLVVEEVRGLHCNERVRHEEVMERRREMAEREFRRERYAESDGEGAPDAE